MPRRAGLSIWETLDVPGPRLLLTLEGYAVEGGLDVAGGPTTCFAPTIALGRHEGPGDAERLWDEYEDVIDLAATLGVDGIRLSLEWARIEPRAGRVDHSALDRYEQVLRHSKSRGLWVTVVLVDATWPLWLGLEPWLLPWVGTALVGHARRVVERFPQLLDGVIPFAQPRELVTGGYLHAASPPWRRGALDEAALAHASIAAISHTLAQDTLVGPLLVATHAAMDLGDAGELRLARTSTNLDELSLRSLVRGTGPTRCAHGVLERREGRWLVSAPAELLSALA